jgi:hypothetical protein
MSTVRFLSALLCSCTSGAVAIAGPSGQELALELELAHRPALYLRLDVDRKELQVRARGTELATVAIRDVLLVRERSPSAADAGSELMLPVVWRVASQPKENWRRVVAPPTLVPYLEESVPESPSVTPTPETVRPSQYRVELADGSQLAVGPSPEIGWFARLGHRLGTGWRRLWGRPAPSRPPTVAIVMSAEAARGLLHVFREGTPILVVRGSDGTSQSLAADPR